MSSTSSGSSRSRERPAARGRLGRRPAVAAGGRAAVAAVVRRQVEALNRRDLETLVALYAEDAVLEFPSSPAVRGREHIRRAFEGFFHEWEEVVTLDALLVDGNRVSAEGTVMGRHRTIHLRLPGRVPAAPRVYRHPFAAFWEVRDGRITRHRVYYDARELVRQLLHG